MSNRLEESLSTVAKGAGIIFIGMITAQILGLANQILLGRFLGPDFYGLFNLALSVLWIASNIAVFGLFGGLSRFIPFYLEKGKKGIIRNTIFFSVGFVLLTSIIISIVLYLLSSKISIYIFNENNLTPVLNYLAIGLPIIALPQIFEGIIRGFKAVKYKVAIWDIGMQLVKIIVFLLLAIIGYALIGAIVAYLMGFIFTIFCSILIIRKKLFPDYSKYMKKPIAKKLLSFSWPLALTGLTFLFAAKTDILLLGYFLNPEAVGIYVPALMIAQLLTFVGTGFSYIFLPVISGFFAQKDTASLESLFKSSTKWIFIIVMPVFLYILLFSKEIIALFFGFEYSKAYLALIILASGVFTSIFSGLTGNILVGGGHTKLNLACEVIAAITNVTLNLVLIPIYGIIGAAIGTSVSLFARTLFSLTFVYITVRMHPFNKNYLKIIPIGILVLGFIYILKTYAVTLLYWPILMLLLGLILLLLYFVLLLPLKILDKNDKFIFEIILKTIERKTGLELKFIRKFINLK